MSNDFDNEPPTGWPDVARVVASSLVVLAIIVVCLYGDNILELLK